MAKEGLVRCVSIKTGKVKYLIPLLANNATRLKNLGFINAEIEAPKKTIPTQPDKPIITAPAIDEREIESFQIPDNTPKLWLVNKGDTFAKIARANGLTIKELKALNNINGEKITEFTELKIA